MANDTSATELVRDTLDGRLEEEDGACECYGKGEREESSRARQRGSMIQIETEGTAGYEKEKEGSFIVQADHALYEGTDEEGKIDIVRQMREYDRI